MRTSARVVANLAFFFVVFLAFLGWAVSNVVTVDAIERPYEISGEFGASSGIEPGAEIAFLGVHYGRVSTVELCSPGSAEPCDARSVRVTMLVDRDRRIPEGSVARVFRKSAVGEPYIDFQPPADFDPVDGPWIEPGPGDEVAVEDTRTPLEFSELLRSFSDLLDNVDPEDAGTLVHELALALDGRAEDLRRLTIAGDRLAATFAERTDALDRLAVNNTRLVEVLSEHRSSLSSAVADLGALAESLRNASGDTQVLLDRGTRLLTDVGDLLVDSRPEIDCLLDDLVTVNRRAAAPEQIEALTRLAEEGPASFDLFWSTREMEADGLWVRVALIVALDHPAPQYVPPRALPEVPALPACPGASPSRTATVTPGAVDFDPAAVLASSRPGPMPATGAAAGLAVGGAAVLLATAVRRLRVHR